MMKQYLLLSVVVLATSSCAGTSQPDQADTSSVPVKRCLASQPKDANMWINAMPGPGATARPPLLTTFKATTPTPGYQFALKVDRVMESHPEQVVLDLIVTKPTGIVPQVVTESQVHIKLPEFPGSEGSAVQVNCGGKLFFKVDSVMAAY